MHLAVADLAHEFDLHLRRERGGAGAAFDGRDDRLDFSRAARADRKFALRAFDDDVRRLATVGDDAVHAHAVAKADALRVHQPKRVHARGERAPSVPGSERGVRGRTVKRGDEALRGERGVREHVAVERVKHHGRVDTLEGARLEETDLAAARLFRGRAEELDRSVNRRRVPREREERAHGGSGDQVVPARVPELRQGVVFREQRHPRSRARTHARPQRRFHSPERAFDRHRRDLFDELGDPAAGLPLFEAELGVLVDAAR